MANVVLVLTGDFHYLRRRLWREAGGLEVKDASQKAQRTPELIGNGWCVRPWRVKPTATNISLYRMFLWAHEASSDGYPHLAEPRTRSRQRGEDELGGRE